MQFGESGDIEGGNKKYWAALAAEFLGMMLFALYGGEARDQAAAYGNGLTLAVSCLGDRVVCSGVPAQQGLAVGVRMPRRSLTAPPHPVRPV